MISRDKDIDEGGKNMKELSLDELDKVSGGTDIGKNLMGDNPMDDETTIPFQCSCGTVFNVRLGDREVKCPNPHCGRIHTING